jgi:peptidoglycan/LPS O-acetylase OafA/YrhL
MNGPQGHEANLDAIRALAVLMVVCSHLSWFFGDIKASFLEPALLGKLGVMIFFVHSGIVNMFSLERHVRKSGDRALFWTFMTRRSFRIYPLSMFMVLVLYISRIPAAHINHWSVAGANHWGLSELIPSLLLVQNYLNYDQILEPLWSLPYEFQIYCLFPFIFLLLRRINSSNFLVFAWAVLAAIDVVVGPRLANRGHAWQVVVIPDLLFYFLLFLAGLISYKQMKTSRRVLPFWTLPMLLGFLCFLWFLSYEKIKPIFTTLSLGLALPYIQESPIRVLNRLCAWVAKYSYGIYLLHDPAIWLAFVRIAHLPLVVRISVFLLFTFGGSVLLYHAIEHPMILVGNKAAAAMAASAPSPKAKSLAAAVS